MAESLPELLPGLVEAVKAVAQLELPDPSDIFVSIRPEKFTISSNMALVTELIQATHRSSHQRLG
jgi:hypothetical protein